MINYIIQFPFGDYETSKDVWDLLNKDDFVTVDLKEEESTDPECLDIVLEHERDRFISTINQSKNEYQYFVCAKDFDVRKSKAVIYIAVDE